MNSKEDFEKWAERCGFPRIDWPNMFQAWVAASTSPEVKALTDWAGIQPQLTQKTARGWCKHCGCGNDKAGYAHHPSCPAAPNHKLDKAGVEQFLSDAQDDISAEPGRMPFPAVWGNLVISWLRGRLDKVKS